MDRFELISKKMELELQVANEVYLSDLSKQELLKKLIELSLQDDSSNSWAKDKKAPRWTSILLGFFIWLLQTILRKCITVSSSILLEILYKKY